MAMKSVPAAQLETGARAGERVVDLGWKRSAACASGALLALPAAAQAATLMPLPLVAVATVPVLGAVCVLLLLGLLWCGYRLSQQRTIAAQLAQQMVEQAQQVQRVTAQLESSAGDKAELERRLREQAESFERLAHEDDLSGLPNRRAFDDAMARDMAAARRNARPLSLMVLSIDHLKQINGTWSRAVGDLVLSEVGDLLRRSLRASDMPARLGNKEFAVLLGDTTLADGQHVCDRLQRLFAHYGEWGGRGEGEIKVTFSAGLVQLGEPDQAPVLFYQRAKNALAQAKQEGRARTVASAG